MLEVKVIGAGLAGCEAAWQLAERGIHVTLVEMKPKKMTPAHHCADFAELAAGVTAEGISGSFTLTTDGRTIPADKISSAFKQADFRTVCHVADYISGKDGIRDLRAYLRKALYTAVQELAQRPKPSGTDRTEKQLEEARRNAYAEDIMDEIRAQYADLAEEPAPLPEIPPPEYAAEDDIMDEIRRWYAEAP